MKKIAICFFIIVLSNDVFAQKHSFIDHNHNGRMDVYEDISKSIDDRVEDLISQMTYREKEGQLLMDLGWNYYDKTGNKIFLTDYATNAIKEKNIGSLWGFYRADPWSGKTLSTGISPQDGYKSVCLLQRYMVDSTRLGIPVFIAEECMHGIMQVGSEVLPTGLLQSSTWDTALMNEAGKRIALLAMKEGINIAFGPMVDIALDARWSRMEETYGEDTYLTSEMAGNFTKGLVSYNSKRYKLLPTLKHFAAYGISEGGHNAGSAHIGKRELKARILPPFKTCIDNGAKLVMTSYNEIDGIPCTMNKYLLQDVLRRDWGFDGIVVSDLHSIGGLRSHYVAKDIEDAAQKSIGAGVDMDLSATDFYNNLTKVDPNRINEAVKRVLYQKFFSGLMDMDFAYPSKGVEYSYNDDIAYKIAREGIILLENKGNILPLNTKEIRSIAVIGPNANNTYNQLGDYTGPKSDDEVVTVYESIKKAAKLHNIEVNYAKGCTIKDTNTSGFAYAVDLAKKSDIIVLCLGGSSSRYDNIEYQNTGAGIVENKLSADITCGEGFDRSSLDLAGVQMKLFMQLKETNKPIILVLINGRSLILTKAREYADAILECFYSGQRGGDAVADVIGVRNFCNPSGRLSVSFPKSIGQLPVYYASNRLANRENYLEMDGKALYPFGYGLSYTSFSYSNMNLSLQNSKNDSVTVNVSVDITNTGKYSGSEVVQVYVKKLFSNYSTPSALLRGFTKVYLNKGESKSVLINLNNDSFREWDADAQYFNLSKGDYEISIRSDAYTPIITKTISIK